MSQLSIKLTRQDLRSHRTHRFRVFVFYEELSGFCHLSVLRVSSLIALASNRAYPGLAREVEWKCSHKYSPDVQA
ncbi:hypothetical protein BV25DRAFT_1828525 [Artomyces pyxidatus]|uniref:Uncharacterized protein n=1 Tax=Artomyces pyxidatus TaxID=48021 RepID=A0ACB8SUH3_9AGAM|nr:hypothetical protein BV25DRAFT_1828525 [Artomyces pyxidatus]